MTTELDYRSPKIYSEFLTFQCASIKCTEAKKMDKK